MENCCAVSCHRANTCVERVKQRMAKPIDLDMSPIETRIIDCERFISDAIRYRRPVVFVSDVKNSKNLLTKEVIEAIISIKARVIFMNKSIHESFVSTDPYFSTTACDAFNHVGRADDNSVFEICQDLSSEILRRCDFSDFEDIRADFVKICESASLSAADEWSSFLRSFIMLNELNSSDELENLILLGNFNYCASMMQCLVHVGVNALILRPYGLEDEKLGKLIRYCNASLHHRLMGKHRPNFDLKLAANKLAEELAGVDLACIVRVGDPVYAQNTSALIAKFNDLQFRVLDNFSGYEDETKNPSLCIDAENFSVSDISGRLSTFSERASKFIARVISKSMSKYDSETFDIIGYSLHPAFFRYNGVYFFRSVLYSLTYYRLFRRVFKFARPALGLVVSPGRRIESRVAVVAAREQGIPSFELQGGTLARSRRFWQPNADYVMCNESESYRVLTEFLGVPPDKVHLVGSPRIDYYTEPYRRVRRTPSGRPLRVFLALQPLSQEITLGMVQVTAEACRNLGDCQLIVGFHPRETNRNRELVASALQETKVPSEINLSSSLEGAASCDVCIVFFSTLGVEAFALGCQVISLNVGSGKVWPFRLSAIGIAAEAYDAAELALLLQMVRDGKPVVPLERVSEIDRKSRESLLDGMSTDRIRRIIQPKYSHPEALPPVLNYQPRSIINQVSAVRDWIFNRRSQGR